MQILLKNDFLNAVKGKKLLVAVSGGVDSMVLLDLLMKTRQKCRFFMEVIHINHNLRGKNSDNDAEFVQKVCQNCNIACNIFSVDVMSNKSAKKQTIEESARELRLGKIFEYAKAGSFDYVVFAHNAGDQAETVLMHIARGSGASGACGIKKRDGILRPLLNVCKDDIYEYARQNNIEFHEDQTNTDIRYSRNFVRHEIIPRLAKIYPNVQENLCKFANLVSADEEYILSTIDFSVIEKTKQGVRLPVDIFVRPVAVYSRIIRKGLNMLGVFADIEQKHIEGVRDLADMKNGNQISLPHGVIAKKEYQYVILMLNSNKKIHIHNQNYKIGKINFDEIHDVVIEEVSADDVMFGDGSLYFDLDSIPHGSVLRRREDGDKFKKFGSGTKTLSDYLTDKKIPKSMREELIVLASNENVLIVLGEEISDLVKITDGTTRYGRVTVTQKN